jgi:hypothetical protein
MDRLVPLAWRGLEKMLLPDGRAYSFRALGGAPGELVNEGRSERYTAMVLIGAAMQAQVGQPVPPKLADEAIWANLVSWALGDAEIGDKGLVLWALIAKRDARAEQVAARILEVKREALADRAGFPSMEMGWLVTGLAEAQRAGVGGPEIGALLAMVAAKLSASQWSSTALFSFGRQLLRKNLFAWREEAWLGSFASQVYPTIAFSAYARAGAPPRFLEAAERAAQRICALQGPEGQWWWVYQVRSAQPAVRYPVYGVHQDAMGLMMLLAVDLAGRPDPRYDLAMAKSLEWLEHRPERPDVPLIDEARGVVWRAVQWDDMKTTGRLGLGAGEIRRMRRVAWTGAADQRPLDGGHPCLECRSYHLGWILYADALDRLRR